MGGYIMSDDFYGNWDKDLKDKKKKDYEPYKKDKDEYPEKDKDKMAKAPYGGKFKAVIQFIDKEIEKAPKNLKLLLGRIKGYIIKTAGAAYSKFLEEFEPTAEESLLLSSNIEDLNFENKEGKKFWKELIRVGSWIIPGTEKKLEVTVERLQKWIDAFKKELKKVPVPLRHSKDPRLNTGWVEDLEIRDNNSLWGLIGFTTDQIEELVSNKSIKDTSISIDPHFKNSESGEDEGEIIDHVALTLDPQITKLEGFQQLEADSVGVKKLVNFEYLKEEDTMEEVKELVEKAKALEKKEAELKKREIALGKQTHESLVKLEEAVKTGVKKIETLEKIRKAQSTKMINEKVESLVGSGKLPPAQKAKVLSMVEKFEGDRTDLEADFSKETLELLSVFEEMPSILTGDGKQATKKETPTGKKLTADDIAKMPPGKMTELMNAEKIKLVGTDYYLDETKK